MISKEDLQAAIEASIVDANCYIGSYHASWGPPHTRIVDEPWYVDSSNIEVGKLQIGLGDSFYSILLDLDKLAELITEKIK